MLDFWAGPSGIIASRVFMTIPAVDSGDALANDCNYMLLIEGFFSNVCATSARGILDLLDYYLMESTFNPLCGLYHPAGGD